MPLCAARLLNPLALGKQIGNFWWKDKRTPVVALDKLDYDFGSLFGEIFVKKVTSGGKYL